MYQSTRCAEGEAGGISSAVMAGPVSAAQGVRRTEDSIARARGSPVVLEGGGTRSRDKGPDGDRYRMRRRSGTNYFWYAALPGPTLVIISPSVRCSRFATATHSA